jgi:peptidyl-tRNA hydrolase
MYILIKEDIPIGYAILAAAHASLVAYLKYKDTEEVKTWLEGPFYKVVCKVTAVEFERFKEFSDYAIITESSLGNQEIAIVFKPREEWPKAFKFLPLYKE